MFEGISNNQRRNYSITSLYLKSYIISRFFEKKKKKKEKLDVQGSLSILVLMINKLQPVRLIYI